jgi:hypothetical protein
MLLENGGARLAVVTGTELFHVDVATGDRTLVSDGTIGAGPEFNSSCSLALDPLGTGYLVTGVRNVLAVDPATGDRTEISGANRGEGIRLTIIEFGGLLTDQSMLVIDPFLQNTILVDLATGDRTKVYGWFDRMLEFGHTGAFAGRLDGLRGILDVAQNRGNRQPPALHTIDLVTGAVARRAD